jgi:hypothetical protein
MGSHTHQSPEFEGFNPCWKDEFFVLLSKGLERSKAEQKSQKRKLEIESEAACYLFRRERQAGANFF